MKKNLDGLVGAFFHFLEKELDNKDYNHIYFVDTNIVHGFPESIEILAQENSNEEDKPNIIIATDVVRRELNGLKKSDNIDKALDSRRSLKGIQQYLSKYDPVGLNDYNLGIRFPKKSLFLLMPYDEEKMIKMREDFGGDDQILSSALTLMNEIGKPDQKKKISVVTDDYDMQTSCFQFDIPSNKFEEFYKDYDYTGFLEVKIDESDNDLRKKVIEAIGSKGTIDLEYIEKYVDSEIYPNQFVRFFGHGIDHRQPFRIDYRNGAANRKFYNFENFMKERKKTGNMPYSPRWEQECALEILYDPSIDYVTLSGIPGCGKTMLSLDAGLNMIKNNKMYSMVVSNPPVDSSHGFLPGSKKEKLKAENQNIFDNLYFLKKGIYVGEGRERNKQDIEKEIMEMVNESGTLELETLNYVKGRTWLKRFILFDEAEDYEPKQMRKLASRLGKGSKMVFVGDPFQIDNPRCSKTRNGLVYFISKFKGKPNYAHLTLTQSERSRGAELAAKLL